MTQSPRKPLKLQSATNIDTALVRDLARLLQETDLSEIEVQKNDFRVRVVRHSPAPATTHVAVGGPAPVAAAMPAAAMPAGAKPAAAMPGFEPVDIPNPHNVPSPMVGTAYRRAAPGAKAFVDIGSKVIAGEKILLIEAMKTFNDIVSPRSGTVTAILFDDGQPVEYGQALMVIE